MNLLFCFFVQSKQQKYKIESIKLDKCYFKVEGNTSFTEVFGTVPRDVSLDTMNYSFVNKEVHRILKMHAKKEGYLGRSFKI